ncbi:MAG: gamma-glutamylcyclotransferase [Rhodobacteraceae bacterium]|nr:gamma-glutamylcyclotransferase [Paracoccaceae bacterium]
MQKQFFFGYGSLVNRRTHTYPDAKPALLKGWRRTWVQTRLRPEAFLSVRPAPGHEIAGLIASVPDQDWRALDEREIGYDRHPVTDHVHHDMLPAPHVQVYAIADRHKAEIDGGPILRSYLDVVVQGFLHHYGDAGAAAFFDTTDGWDRGVLDDRTAPQYPRHQRLSTSESALIDRHLEKLQVKIALPK